MSGMRWPRGSAPMASRPTRVPNRGGLAARHVADRLAVRHAPSALLCWRGNRPAHQLGQPGKGLGAAVSSAAPLGLVGVPCSSGCNPVPGPFLGQTRPHQFFHRFAAGIAENRNLNGAIAAELVQEFLRAVGHFLVSGSGCLPDPYNIYRRDSLSYSIRHTLQAVYPNGIVYK